MYGGFGNDLLNVDDDLATNGGANDAPDTSASYEDRAYGGAGRDVLMANTGGDRLIDWSGEYNSYLVPFSPFGTATVSRSLQPALFDFLYALSKSDGADFTRAADAGTDPARNGEPMGELGMVLQQDAAWGDQHGGPADPQPGNGRAARDVLRSASFDAGAASGFTPQVGTFSVVDNAYQVAPSTAGGDAVSLFNQSDTEIPISFEMQASINAMKPLGGAKANAFLIFDWQSNTDFKFAGIDVSTNKLEIGHRTASGWVIDQSSNAQLKAGTNYVVLLQVNGTAVTLTQGRNTVSFTFAAHVDAYGFKHGLNEGIAGIGSMEGASSQIDDVVVQSPPRVITLDKTADFATVPAGALFDASPLSGSWVTSNGRFVASAASGQAVNLIHYAVTPGAMVELTARVSTTGQGGIVFDYHGPSYYKFAALSVSGRQIVIGHVTESGTVIDKSYAASLTSGRDYTLGVTLRGGLVNVSLDGAVVASKLYNETVTIGGYGALGQNGVTSFDSLRLRSDEASYAQPLMADAAGAADSGGAPSAAQLDAALVQAEQYWSDAGYGPQTLGRSSLITVQAADLGGLTLGATQGTSILIDSNAAGWGWSSGGGSGVDLVGVLTHEVGHALGFAHDDEGVMAPTLAMQSVATGGERQPMDGEIVSGTFDAAPFVVTSDRAIDWSASLPESGSKAKKLDKAAPSQPAWLGDFVNHLARSEGQRNPNLGIRVEVSAASRVSGSLKA